MQKTLYEMFKMFVNHILFERGIFHITTTYLVLLDFQCRPYKPLNFITLSYPDN